MSHENSTMPRCKTCKHWSPVDDESSSDIPGTGECEKAPQMWDVTEAVDGPDAWTSRMQLRPEHAAVLAIVVDGSSYRARLVTMPDFGCVQHEQAEPPEA